jgi:hypothetical protein
MSDTDQLHHSLGFTIRPGDPGTESAESLWQELAFTADFHGGRPSGRELATRINATPFADEFAAAIGSTIARILASDPNDSHRRQVLADVSDLIIHLHPGLVGGILRGEPDPRRRLEFLERAVTWLPLAAAFRLVAALAALAGHPLSEPLRVLLRKMAHRTTTLPPDLRVEAEEPLRATLDNLVINMLTRPAREMTSGFEPVTQKLVRRADRATPEAERVVQMAIEVGTLGDAVWTALNDMTESSGVGPVVELIKRWPAPDATTSAIMKRVVTPQELARALEQEPLDQQAVDAMLQGLGLGAARVMLETLVESRSRVTRRFLLERLVAFGPQIQPMVEGRLRDSRWFVQRNMIALLRAAACRADMSTAGRLLQSGDPRVRREVVLWCLETAETRERAIIEALKDSSADVLRPGLQAARAGLPQAAVPILAKRVLDADFPPGFRVLALSLLGRSGSALALEALLHYSILGKTFMSKPKLAPKSPEMLAAVAALARSWRSDSRVSGLLRQALKSRDPQVVAAARGGAPEPE